VAGQRGNLVLTGAKSVVGIPAPYPFQERAEGWPVSMNTGGELPRCPLLPVRYGQALEMLARERRDSEM